MRLPKGTILVGITRKHPGRIKIIGVKTNSYRIRACGSQHSAKKECILPAAVIEANYRVLQLPRRNKQREHVLQQLPPLEQPGAAGY
jgi:hypothetical protein